jgi:hypothetical protein
MIFSSQFRKNYPLGLKNPHILYIYMNTLTGRNRTLKKNHDISGDVIAIAPRKNVSFESDTLLQFLEQDAGGAYKRQWHRLERGLRLNRLRKFSTEEAQRLNLSEGEKTALYNLLAKSLDRKLLNSKTSVIYDQDKQAITEIKGLVMHRSAEGTVLFQLLDKQKAVTFRKKKPSQEDVITA